MNRHSAVKKACRGSDRRWLIMGDAMQSILYGICVFGLCAVVAGFCSGVKSLCLKILKRRKSHDGK